MNRRLTRPPGSESSDRLTVTLFLAGAFHLIVILGITFAPPLQDPSLVPTLEVLLVNNSLPDAPANDRASYLAERTQQGSGNSRAARTRQPGAGDAPQDSPGAADGIGRRGHERSHPWRRCHRRRRCAGAREFRGRNGCRRRSGAGP